MMMPDHELARLARYFAGECPPAEALETQHWIAAERERQVAVEQLHALWLASAAPVPTPDVDAAWQRLAVKLTQGGAIAPVSLHHTAETPVHRFRWQRTTTRLRDARRLAAAGLLLVAGSVAVAKRDALTRLGGVARQEIVEAPSREFRTARGQRAVIVLGDGTRVELGAESVLRVRPFGIGPRRLFLEGQAVFDVVHDTAHPFIVHAANAVTEDLGTRFSIRAYSGGSRVEVLVTSGKVALRAAGAPSASGTLLGPADLGVLDSTGRATVRNGVDSTAYLAWTRDRFVYDNAPLAEVLPDIARWFDVKVGVADPRLLQRRVTMSVPARTLSEVLGAATMPLHLSYSTTGGTVVIR